MKQCSKAAADDWYLKQCRQGQQLLDGGRIDQALEMFQTILVRLEPAAGYARAAVLERLGRCLLAKGQPGQAGDRLQEALAVSKTLAAGDSVQHLQGMLQADLGDVLRASGQPQQARACYQAALQIAERLDDRRARGVNLGQLGALALAQDELDEALACYRAALDLFQQLREPAMEMTARYQLGRVLQERQQWSTAESHFLEAAAIAQKQGDPANAARAWNQLGMLQQQAGNPQAATDWFYKAIDSACRNGRPRQLMHYLNNLAALLQQQPATSKTLHETRRLTEQALVVVRAGDPAAAQVWQIYGILADIIEQQAAGAEDEQQRAALQTQVRDYRQLQQFAPQIVAAYARFGSSCGYAGAVIRARLGRCFLMSGQPAPALEQLHAAVTLGEQLASDDDVQGLCGMLYSELAGACCANGRYDDARAAAERALQISGQRQDLQGQTIAHRQLAAIFEALGRPAAAAQQREAARLTAAGPEAEAAVPEDDQAGNNAGFCDGFTAKLYQECTTDYVIEPDLLLDGRRERRISRKLVAGQGLAGDVRPVLVPGTRYFADDDGSVRFCLPADEPVLVSHPGCTAMRRSRRELVLAGRLDILWRLIRDMDGVNTVTQLLDAPAGPERSTAGDLLDVLAAAGVIDVSGRALGRLLHTATKKGVVAGGGLDSGGVLQLVTDGNYRNYPGAARITVDSRLPESLCTFHTLTRARRSRRDYLSQPVARADFDALLHTACGVTGTISWAGRETRLRAYPSSGGLYAVEIYPVVLRVDELQPAVYHYQVVDNALERVKPDLDIGRFVAATLPVEREMVAGAAAMICLTGVFTRHEHKYGEGGYRMLVAEAGHISQNLILAATALGLSARPFGGVFDTLLNQDLGLDEEREQFLLAVLIGHAGAAGATSSPAAG